MKQLCQLRASRYPLHSAIRAQSGRWGGPLDRAGRPRPAAERGVNGLRAGKGVRRTTSLPTCTQLDIPFSQTQFQDKL
jgi:hypothetical protein